MAKLFNFKLTKSEIRRIFDLKRLIVGALGSLATHFVILAPLEGLLWPGWMVVISTVVGMMVAEYLR